MLIMNIKQNGNRNWLNVLVMLILLMSMTACAGLNDWTIDDLPGEGYAIMRINGQDIALVKSERKVIERYIVAYSYDTRYIGLQRIPIDLAYNEYFDVHDLDFSKLEYYLVDSQTEVIYGPCTQDEYAAYLEEFNIPEMTKWKLTNSELGGKLK